MIRVYIELDPQGNYHKRKTIGRFEIWNVDGDLDIGNYDWAGEFVDFMRSGSEVRSGHISAHRRIEGGVALVRKVLLQADSTTAHRESVQPLIRVTSDERLLDVSAALSMLLMTLETSKERAPAVSSVMEKARAALIRSRQ